MTAISRLEQATGLDRVVTAGQRVVRRLGPGRARDALHGVWLGHPLHPVLVQAPVGAWLSAAVLDLFPRGEQQSRRLVAFGLVASAPAALAGAADWSEQHEQQMRVDVVHAAAIADGQQMHMLADRCSHLSGPLSDGDVGDGCLTCPWHGSTFRISDGSVVHGPATAPQPVFETRVRRGVVQACLPGAG